MDELKYPIGAYTEKPFSAPRLREWINDIKYLPENIERAILNLDETQLNTPYRPDGWTIKQVVHHVADSHMNAYIRFKLALTEDNPTIKPYREELWAELSDTKNLPINISITLLHALHIRWVEILNNVQDDEWNRTIFHPQYNRKSTLWYLLGSYSWHGRHHTAHITSLRESMKW